MGKAMRLPASTRNNGKDAELIPWTLAPLHQSLAALNKRSEAANLLDGAATQLRQVGVEQQRPRRGVVSKEVGQVVPLLEVRQADGCVLHGQPL
jgi:hypothetical protein